MEQTNIDSSVSYSL